MSEFLRWAIIGVQALIIALFVWRGIARQYKWFLVLLSFQIARSLALAPFEVTSPPYRKVFAATVLLVVALSLKASSEISSRIFEDYPNIGAFGKKIARLCMYVGFGIGVTASVFSFEALNMPDQPWYVDASRLAVRAAGAGIFVCLVVQGIWYRAFPWPICRNATTHRVLYGVFFGLVPAIRMWLVEAFSVIHNHEGVVAVNLWMSAVALAGLVAYCVLMTRSGEITPQPINLSKEEQERRSANYETIMKEWRGRMGDKHMFSPRRDY